MLLDVFKKDAYNLVSLTTAINKLPFAPSAIGAMGLFNSKGVTTRTVAIEERDGKLILIPTAARGTMPHVSTRGKRKIRNFDVPYIPDNRAIWAYQIQGVRAFGSEDEEETVATIVNDNLAEMRQNFETTEEWHRIGAIQGIVLDADGTSVIYNWFDEFGITETVVNFDFTVLQTLAPPGAATLAAGAAGALTGAYTYKVTFVTAQGETQGGTASNQVTLTAQKGSLTAIPTSADSAVIARGIYRTQAGGSTYTLVQYINDNTTTTFTDNATDASIVSAKAVPTSNTTPGNVYQAQAVMDMKTQCTKIIRLVEDALGMDTYTGITAVCGNQFWDNFISHPSVVHAYERWQNGQFFQTQQRGGPPFRFADIDWINYRGHLGSTYFVPDKQARFFPTGVQNLFQVYYAPADFMETVNTIGKPYYAKQEPMRMNTGVELHAQTNPLYVCTRPSVLIEGLQVNP